MLEFDGQAYLDGAASDPNRLGWMQGAPPAVKQRIRFEDDKFFRFPEIRWSLSHIRELMPSATVWRGPGAPSDLGSPSSADTAAIEALQFTDMHGKTVGWSQSLSDTYTDGILILHKGKTVYERYFGALSPQRAHACFSITKSYAATLTAMLVHERVLDENQLIPHYLPEMAGTAYADATLRQVMDMQIGVRYSEAYADPTAEIWMYGRAGGLRPRPEGYVGPTNYYDYLKTLAKEGAHGEAFAYKTVNTEVMCWVMARVTGLGFADLLSQRIWSRLGCNEDGYVVVDSIGVAMGGGGLNATLKDLGRFGEMMRCQGAWQGEQVIPAAVVADIRRGEDPKKFAKAGYTLLPEYSYRSMWWVSAPKDGYFEGRGIHGQRLYIAPAHELVIARFASHPVATSAANDPVTLPAFAAVAKLTS